MLQADVSSFLNQIFSSVGWDIFQNTSTSTLPPTLDTVRMTLEMTIQNLQYHMQMQQQKLADNQGTAAGAIAAQGGGLEDDGGLPAYHRGLATHFLVLDLKSGRRRPELASVVIARLHHCADLAGYKLPPQSITADAICLHGEDPLQPSGAVISWRTPPAHAAAAALCVSKLRQQLPMSINQSEKYVYLVAPSAVRTALPPCCCRCNAAMLQCCNDVVHSFAHCV